MTFVDDDLDAFFEDFSSVVVFGTVTTKGIFDQGTKAEDFVSRGGGFAPVMADDPSVLVKASLGVRNENVVFVDGLAYTVRNREASADGKVTRLFLQESPL